MKFLLFNSLLIFAVANTSFSQQWKSLMRINSFGYIPVNQFEINQYKNQIWFVQDKYASVIENNGSVTLFDDGYLGPLWNGDELHFLFTTKRIYYFKESVGLFCFDNYISSLKHDISLNIRNLTNNGDTIYFNPVDFPNPYFKYIDSNVIITNHFATNIYAKNTFEYVDLGSKSYLAYYNGPTSSDFVEINSDINYLGGVYNDAKFSRLTDTLYVGCKKGISYAYNYDFLDSITPNNTTNMPSSNVLEIEFDHLDRLWAVFGDANNQAFSIAMLNGNTWINYFDTTNSPIQFVNTFGSNGFRGLEIDTLGNIWVCDDDYLHTLLSATTPTWMLNTVDLEKSNFDIYPNPVENNLTISFKESIGEKNITLFDLKGNNLNSWKTSEQKTIISLENVSFGLYYVRVESGANLSFSKIFKR